MPATVHDHHALAEQRAERIRQGMCSMAALIRDIAAAWANRDWEPLGYPDWHAYVEGEFTTKVKVPPAERAEVLRALRLEGMNYRAIAVALGISKSTVGNILGPESPHVTQTTDESHNGSLSNSGQPAASSDNSESLTQMLESAAAESAAAESAAAESAAAESAAAESAAAESVPVPLRKLLHMMDANLGSVRSHVDYAARLADVIGAELGSAMRQPLKVVEERTEELYALIEQVGSLAGSYQAVAAASAERMATCAAAEVTS